MLKYSMTVKCSYFGKLSIQNRFIRLNLFKAFELVIPSPPIAVAVHISFPNASCA